MGTTVLDEIRQDLRGSMRSGHANESVTFGSPTAAAFFDQADWFAEHVTSRASALIQHVNERGS